jgi:hypothetical protein
VATEARPVRRRDRGSRFSSTPSSGSPPIHEASLVFIGFTNIPAKGDRAVFSCTNGSAKPICFLVENFDTASSGSWKTNRLDNGDRKGGLTEEAKRWLSGFIGTPSRLGPNEGSIFYAPSPVTNTAWRVRFLYVEQTVGDRIRKLTIGGVELPADSVIANGEYFTGRRYKLLSSEIPK